MTEEEILKKEQELALREFNLEVWTAREKKEHKELNLTQTQSIRKVVKVLAEEHFCAKEKEIATIVANGEHTLELVKQIIEDRKEQEKVHREEKDRIADNLKEFNGTIRTAIENLEKSNKETFNELFKGRNENKGVITKHAEQIEGIKDKVDLIGKVAIWIVGTVGPLLVGAFLFICKYSYGIKDFFHHSSTGGTP